MKDPQPSPSRRTLNNYAIFYAKPSRKTLNKFGKPSRTLIIPLFKLAKLDVILIRFKSFSILFSFENSGFSTHYFSFHTLLVPIQYQLFFSLLCVVPVACRSINYSENNHQLVCKFTYRNYNLKLLFLQQKVLWY